MKADIFRKELLYIKDTQFRIYITQKLNELPDEFYTVPASSTGKYHPNYALGNGGLVRHTKACVGIAMEMIKCEAVVKDGEAKRDILIGALLLHDGMKCGIDGKSKHTTVTHPIDMAKYLQDTYKSEISKDKLDILCRCIASHMGNWNTDRSGREVLPKPQTGLERIVHLCDYLASRKCLEFNFEV